MKLQQLARVVLIEVVDGVLLVVEIAQHRRVARDRAEQIAETTERARAYRSLLVVAHHGAHVALVLMHVEVVQPEPGHVLQQLVLRVQRAQQVPRRRLAREARELLLIRLLRGLAALVARCRLQHRPRSGGDPARRNERDQCRESCCQ